MTTVWRGTVDALRGFPQTAMRWANLAAAAALAVLAVWAMRSHLYVAGYGGHDARAYWLGARDLAALYDTPWHGLYAFVYSPAFAQGLAPLAQLPWEPFYIAWVGLSILALALLAGPVLALVLLLAWQPVHQEIGGGNVDIFVGLAIAAGFRYPGAWAFVLLSKVTPGIGLLWFVVRREWRKAAAALGATAAIVAVSFVLAPGLWFEWFAFLRSAPDTTPPPGTYVAVTLPMLPRLALAAGIVTWGALTDRPWAVLVAAFVGSPLPTSTRTTMLLGLLPMLGWGPLAAAVRVASVPPARSPQPAMELATGRP